MKAVIIVLGVLVSGAAGYAIGRFTVPKTLPLVSERSHVAAGEGTSASTGPSESSAPRETPASSDPSANALPLRDRLRQLCAMPAGLRWAYEVETYFATLSLSDLPQALAALQEMPFTKERSGMISALFERWGELDGPAALALTSQLPGRDRLHAEMRVFTGWGKTNPRAAWGAAKASLAESSAVFFRGGGAMREFARVDLMGAFQESNTLNSNTTQNMTRSVIVDAAAESGKLPVLLQAAMQLPADENRSQWIQAVFQRWGSVDTDAPMQALRAIADPELARSAMSGVITRWAEMDPRGALEFALENHSDPLMQGSLGRLMGNTGHLLRQTDLREVLTNAKAKGTLGALPPEAVFPLAHFQPSIAMEFVDVITDEPNRNRLISSAMSSWSRNDFAAAAGAFERMPQGTDRVTAFESLSSVALERVDGGATVASWLGTFSGADRVKLAEGLVRQLDLRQKNRRPALRPEVVASLADAFAQTPNLPVATLEQARNLLQPATRP